MEYFRNFLHHLIAGFILSTLLFFIACDYRKSLRAIRPAYLMIANKTIAAIVLLKTVIMFMILPNPFDANNILFYFPLPVFLFEIVLPCTLSVIALRGKRAADKGFTWLLVFSLLITKVIEYVLLWNAAQNGNAAAAKQASDFPYIRIIIATVVFFGGCYYYTLRKIGKTSG
ncbi:hypothetical protein HGH92_23385 [Chitinophaga varians]|uniref:Uncharacterized protein n=1 Tax=Chitinophaga varians TaxID=2202339 RepID=A0A847RJS6_9BACT|nr:hypothetical protein [Chitinophaga varians]NLR67269.1 hypothetical protein [Chitinophaga varians]